MRRPIVCNLLLIAVASTCGSLTLSACNSYDAPLNAPSGDPSSGNKKDGGSAIGNGTAGIPGTGDKDAGPERDAAGPDMPGTGGSGGSTGPEPTMCHPNPDTENEVCTMICPEVCNGMDDDCDLKIDEDRNTICNLAHATSLCTKAGECRIVDCLDHYRDCDGMVETGCEAPEDDINNCGTCGKKCQVTHGKAVCELNQCEQDSCDAKFDDCDSNQFDCESSTYSLDNCGGCGIKCENVPNATPSCAKGYCGPGKCDDGFDDCNGIPGDGCEEPLNSVDHCGACKTKCSFTGATGVTCDGNTLCAETGCDGSAGYADCDGDHENGCESLNTELNCGTCGTKCAVNATLHIAAASCANPTCTLTCEDGWGDCDGDTQTGCETPLNSLTHCGSCAGTCDFTNAVADCSTGQCTLAHCNSGFDDCTGGPSDGCETPLDTDDHCGGCNTMCSGGKHCSGGMCSSANCSVPPHDMADCNGTKCANCDHSDESNCETDLDSNLNNCGACGNVCAFTSGGAAATATLACKPAGCTAVCNPGYGDCNGDYRDGCEKQLNTLSDCDACGQSCAIANASAKCTTWNGSHFVCEVASCNPDYADCDMDKMSCESALNTVQHCGNCGTTCNLANASEACTGSTGMWSCTIAACDQTYYKNCNTTQSDGCEIDTRTSVANCGACSNDCRTHAHVASATCSASACNYTCASGYKSCNSMPGCETDIHTLTDCGGCGVTCSRTNGTASCSTGACTLTGCNAGYSDCDSNPNDGCEPLNTLTDCGTCGTPCNLANATSSCSTGSCVISTCNTNWADCDASPTNGCERDIRAPASGGLGPCLPDTGCVKVFNATNMHTYYFCPTVRTWTDARMHCQQQLLGDLVRIDDQAENDFVKSNLGGDSWLGATDASVEGAWRWIDNSAQFWSGKGSGAGGSAVGGLYTQWNGTAEPNDSSSNEDCAQMYQSGTTAGKWNDTNCTGTLRFVCEVQDDLCPNDPNKKDPLQCGCGNPDVDADGDGTASCNGTNDKCDSDPAKVAPGQCGCGNPDTDGDGDGVANCVDACPTDPAKSASAGQCGCNKAETDTDADGTADCNDKCMYDATHSAVPCSYAYTPTNITGTGLFTGAPDLSAACSGTFTYSTDSTSAISICGVSITPVVQTQTTGGGPQVWVLPLNSLTLASGTNLRFTGSRPVVIAVANDATIGGTIDVGAQGSTAGAGGNVSCAVGTGQGADGVRNSTSDKGDGGGGGGGFGNAGATGGSGDSGGAGGAAGATNGVASLQPLRGGCRGGAVQTGGNVNGAGAGGGALQIEVGGKLTLSATAVVAAAGGGGSKGSVDEDGGGGGGSGGAVFIEALTLNVDAAAWISANGGGGAGGNATNSTNATPGTDGLKNNTSKAPGGSGGTGSGSMDSDGGGGGQGAALAGAAGTGSNAGGSSCCVLGCWCGSGAAGGGGGGGGGGVGRIRIHGILAGCSVPTAKISPAATIACP